jgi:hypothetical protein
MAAPRTVTADFAPQMRKFENSEFPAMIQQFDEFTGNQSEAFTGK